MSRKYRDREVLYELYVEEEMTCREIADQLNCGSTTIQNWLDKHNIEKRDRGGNSKNAPWKDEETLRRLYYEEGMSQSEIGEELGCTQVTVYNQMKKFDIEARDLSESVKAERNGFYGKTHDEETRQIFSENAKEQMAENHPMEGREHTEEAKRKMSENTSGENHPFWSGGHETYRGPSWTDELKEVVREEANYICEKCDQESDETLHVHHIVPFRFFGLEKHEQANSKVNLRALCPSCHREQDAKIQTAQVQKSDVAEANGGDFLLRV